MNTPDADVVRIGGPANRGRGYYKATLTTKHDPYLNLGDIIVRNVAQDGATDDADYIPVGTFCGFIVSEPFALVCWMARPKPSKWR